MLKPMQKIILFGATGMVGQGALREALADSHVSEILCIGRRSCGLTHPKLHEMLLPDLFDTHAVQGKLSGYDACVWALGISSIGLDEAAYARVTETLTLLWARELLKQNPKFSFSYCSAMGAGGGGMWARVRQRVEGELKTMGFQYVGVVRPGMIQPGPGIKSQVKIYQAAIVLGTPLFPILIRLLPSIVTNSARLGRAMLRIVQGRADKFILESSDINRLGL